MTLSSDPALAANQAAARLPADMPLQDLIATLLAAVWRHLTGHLLPADLLIELDLAPATDDWILPLTPAKLPAAVETWLSLCRTAEGLHPERETRRRQGTFYTPTFLSDRMLRSLAPLEGDWCDPACGAGAFLFAALQQGVRAARLHGFDRDPLAVLGARLQLALGGLPSAQAAAQVRWLDPLLSPPASRFDGIIGNPPWGLAFDRPQRAALAREWRLDPGEICSAALFVELARRLVRPGGRIALVLPETWLSSRRAEPLRRRLLAETCIRGVDVYRKGVFPAAPDMVPTVLHLTAAPPDGAAALVRMHGLNRPLPPRTAGWASERWIGPDRWHAEPFAVFSVGVPRELDALWDRLAGLPRLGAAFSAHDGYYKSRLMPLLASAGRPVLTSAAAVRRHRLGEAQARLDDAGWARLPAAERARQARAKLLCHALRKPALADRLVAASDLEGAVVASNNLVLLLPRPRTPWPLDSLAAWVNSRVMNRWFADRFLQVNIDGFALMALPLPASPPAELAELGRRAREGEPVEAEIEALLDYWLSITPAERAAIDQRWAP